VDLRERAEGARFADAHFVAALDLALDLALDRQLAAEGALELAIARGAAEQPARHRDPASGRDHGRLDALPDRDLEPAVLVLQLGNLDRRLALAADVDEGDLGPDPDDQALDRLSPVEPLRLGRRLEHRGE